MTAGASWIVACAMMLAATAPLLAQQRPPEPPTNEAPQTGGAAERPPERPEPAPKTENKPPAPEGAAPPALPAEVFGPPPPPRWFTLAENETSFAACRLALSILGTRYSVEPPVTDPDDRDCGIARPLRITQIVPGVELTGAPLMRCDAARALGFWTRDFLQPAAALLPGAPRLEALETGPAYSCRDRVGTGAADPKPSEHGFGNAIDIMGFRLAGAEPIAVMPRAGDGDAAEAYLRAARGTACLLFTTVLGPGSNAAHDDHLHLDVAERNGGWRLCE